MYVSFYLSIAGQIPSNFRAGKRKPAGRKAVEDDDDGLAGGGSSGDDDPDLDLKTPAVVAAEAAAAAATRDLASATEELEKLRQKTATDSLARAQSEAAALRSECARLRAAANLQQPPAISLSSSTSSSSSSSSSASSSSTTSSSSLSSAGAIPPRTSPGRGQLGKWVEYQRECEAQGVHPSAVAFAQWQTVQGVALPPATPTPPRGPALSRVSPQARYPGEGVGSPPMAFGPPSPLSGVMPYGAPFAFPGYGQPPPRMSESGNVNINVARLLALLGTAPSGWQPAPGSGL